MALRQIRRAIACARAACAIAAISLATGAAAQAPPQYRGSLSATAQVSITILDPADVAARRARSLGWVAASPDHPPPAAALSVAAAPGEGRRTMALQGPPDTAYSLSRTLVRAAGPGRQPADQDSRVAAGALPPSGLRDLGWDEPARRGGEASRGPQPAVLTIIASYN